MLDLYRTSDWIAFVNSIRERPADDTRRLAAADWLEERDQPLHADFIRKQIEHDQFERYHSNRIIPAGAERHQRCTRSKMLPDLIELEGVCPRCKWMRDMRNAKVRTEQLNELWPKLLKDANVQQWLPSKVTTLPAKKRRITRFGTLIFERGFASKLVYGGDVSKFVEIITCQPVRKIVIHPRMSRVSLAADVYRLLGQDEIEAQIGLLKVRYPNCKVEVDEGLTSYKIEPVQNVPW